MADCRGSPPFPKAGFGRSGSCREGELAALVANSVNRPETAFRDHGPKRTLCAIFGRNLQSL